MEDFPKITVVVPVYNAELWLRTCLDSVVGQTLRELEILCVDDGSTDASPEILREYASRDDRIQVLTQANGGASVARNRGIRAARGTYLWFLDSDDYLAVPDALERLYRRAEEENLDLLLFDAVPFCEEESLTERTAQIAAYCTRVPYLGGPAAGVELIRFYLNDPPFPVMPVLYLIRREFLLREGLLFPEGIVCEDELFTPLLLLAAGRADYVAEKFYRYRVRGNSVMTAFADGERLRSMTVVFKALLEAGRDPDLWEICWRIVMRDAINLLDMLEDFSAEERERAWAAVPPDDRDTLRILLSSARDLQKAGYDYEYATEEIRASWTYRIGRFITWLPRKLRKRYWALFGTGNRENEEDEEDD